MIVYNNNSYRVALDKDTDAYCMWHKHSGACSGWTPLGKIAFVDLEDGLRVMVASPLHSPLPSFIPFIVLTSPSSVKPPQIGVSSPCAPHLTELADLKLNETDEQIKGETNE